LDALAEGYGGLARLKVEAGYGTLRPGEVREVRVSLRIPREAQVGSDYWGTWSFHNVNYYVGIDVTGEVATGKE
jgi:hypothetical protein